MRKIFAILVFVSFIAGGLSIKHVPLESLWSASALTFVLGGLVFASIFMGWKNTVQVFKGENLKAAYVMMFGIFCSSIIAVVGGYLSIQSNLNNETILKSSSLVVFVPFLYAAFVCALIGVQNLLGNEEQCSLSANA